MTVRTRFAPSPTGFMHVGGVRTALFAWFLARQANGQFILRIEDTDQAREVEGSADHIQKSLKALGITWDEGPDIDGPHGPYLQSKRLDIYKQWAQKLIDSGRAYADPYTPEELQALRENAQAEKRAFLYRDHRPENPPAWDGSTPLRFKSEPKEYSWHDEVMGALHTGPEVVDDFILVKSDGFPTYNFAHIVDDAEMGITHVIRGQEFISSMPNYLNLYEALGFDMRDFTASASPGMEAPPLNRGVVSADDYKLPVFATMPHIMSPTGNKKLSKRDGAKDVLDYFNDGFLPEAMMNFIASMGWNDGTEQEVFTVDELIKKFTLDRVQKSGARFDEQRMLWLNGQHIRMLELDDLYARVADFWPESANSADETHKKEVLKLVQDRLKTLKDLPTASSYFFADPAANWQMVDDNKQLGKLGRDRHIELLKAAKSALETSEFDPIALQDTLNQLLETTGEKPGILFSLIRFAITWAPFSPGLPDTMAILGKETVLNRLQTAIDAV